MSEPDFVGKPYAELESLLASKHFQNPYPYPGNIEILPSYSSEPPESAHSMNLREQAKHALANAWKYDPIGCSVKGAFRAARDMAGAPNHGLTEEEYNWIIGAKLTTAKTARSSTRKDFEKVKEYEGWRKNLDGDNEVLTFDGTSLDQELDEFYGPDGTDLRPIEDDSNDEGFSEPNAITTTVISLPDKSLLEPGVTPGGIFQDSGICMDAGYAEYSLAHSLPHVQSNWPISNADIAPLRVPKQNGRPLGLFGDQKQLHWPGRRQAPHDLDGLDPWIKGSKEDDVESQDEYEACDCDSEDLAGFLTPQPVPREATATRDVGTAVGHHDDATPQMFGQEQNPTLQGNKVPGRHIAFPERISHTSVSNKDVENDEVSVGVAQSVSEERPHHFLESTENGSNIQPSVPVAHMIRGTPQIDADANAHAPHSVPTTAFATPENQRIRQIQQIEMDIPTTPATVNINLTPKHDSGMDADGSSDGSLEVHLPISPTIDTLKGQSALGRYVQDTKLHPNLAQPSSSTISLAGSESEEVSLVPTQESPSRPEGHAGFSKGVEFHQKKSDAVFTLSPANASHSSSKIAPVPVTPAKRVDSASFRPTTPFQIDTPVHPDYDSPGTPTPASKAGKAKGKSVMNVFKSPKLGSRSPEHARLSPDIIAAPTAPAAGAGDQYRGSPSGGVQGLLFQKAKRNETGTKNVLSSLKLSPERGSGTSAREGLEDYVDELAGEKGVEVYRGRKWVQETSGIMKSGTNLGAAAGRKVAQAVVVPSVRCREENDGDQFEHSRSEEPRKKKMRRSTKAAGGADAADVGSRFGH